MGTQSPPTLDYTETELVLGFVYAVGTNAEPIQAALQNHLKKFGYGTRVIRLSQYLPDYVRDLDLQVELKDEPQHERIATYMNAGNKLRATLERGDVLALSAVADIHRKRSVSADGGTEEPYAKTAHILLSLKHPDEVITLRRIYGAGFFVMGVFATEKERLDYLTTDLNSPRESAENLLRRDQAEEEKFGQQTRDTFKLADVFVGLKEEDYRDQLWRFLDLVFGDPFRTPTPDENAMFLAYAASARSSSLSRQVGAVVTNATGELVSVGCNDVPCAGGGLYWTGPFAQRDHECVFRGVQGLDSNEAVINDIISDIIRRLDPHVKSLPSLGEAKKLLGHSLLVDITEYGRSVHAEMEAILSCARAGVSPRNGTLYTTTFPCHNCARHIIDAGLRRVVYIEPYPKSRAKELHSDSITLTGEGEEQNSNGCKKHPKVEFEPFVGVGPRRYFDLFSTRLSSEYPVERKTRDGRKVSWTRDSAYVRVPMLPTSYIQREILAGKMLELSIKNAKKPKEASDAGDQSQRPPA